MGWLVGHHPAQGNHAAEGMHADLVVRQVVHRGERDHFGSSIWRKSPSASSWERSPATTRATEATPLALRVQRKPPNTCSSHFTTGIRNNQKSREPTLAQARR
jgi:hypothetical protein